MPCETPASGSGGGEVITVQGRTYGRTAIGETGLDYFYGFFLRTESEALVKEVKEKERWP